jgi:predicted ATPase/DNA-binding CsgD family transcriptional regulator
MLKNSKPPSKTSVGTSPSADTLENGTPSGRGEPTGLGESPLGDSTVARTFAETLFLDRVLMFTDIEGSADRWDSAPETMRLLTRHHDSLATTVVERHGGVLGARTGDGVIALFVTSTAALNAALEFRALLSDGPKICGLDAAPLSIRIGLHRGVVEPRDGEHYGPPMHRTARIMAAGHGGQIVASELVANELALALGVQLTSRVAGISRVAGSSGVSGISEISGIAGGKEHADTLGHTGKAGTAGTVGDTQAVLALRERVTLADRGVHRLKGFHEPERLTEILLTNTTPDPRGLRVTTAAGSLPTIDLEAFVGRDEHVKNLLGSLTAGKVITLLGPGGVGKTRFALQVATLAQRQFTDGAWFVDLAAVSNPERVLRLLADTLEIADDNQESLAGLLRQAFHSRQMLLVLDNCEHVLEAVRSLLSRAWSPSMSSVVLATSQRALDLPGERREPLAPLSFTPVPSTTSSAAPSSTASSSAAAPGVGATSGATAERWVGTTNSAEADRSPAARMFVLAARNADSLFEPSIEDLNTIDRICERLDGLPLAIELAASRVRVMSVAQIADELAHRFDLLRSRDQPERHRTLASAMAWSIALLSSEDRETLLNVSVFAGEFDVDAAAAVCGIDRFDALDSLDELVRRSLLVRGGVGVRMLVPLRLHCGAELLGAGNTEKLHTRHANWISQKFRGPIDDLDPTIVATRLDEVMRSVEDIHSAHSFLVDHDPSSAAILAMALVDAWVARGRSNEALQLFLACDVVEMPPDLHVEVLGWIAALAWTVGSHEEGEHAALRAMDLAEEHGLGLPLLAAVRLSVRYAFSNRPVLARQLLDCVEAELRSGRGNPGKHFPQLGVVAAVLGDMDAGLLLADEGLALAREAGALQLLTALTNRVLLQPSSETVATMAVELAALAQVLGRTAAQAHATVALAHFARKRGDLLGFLSGVGEFGSLLLADEPTSVIQTMQWVPGATATQLPRETVVLLGSLEALGEHHNYVGTEKEHARRRTLADQLLVTMGVTEFNRAWAEGSSLNLAEVIDRLHWMTQTMETRLSNTLSMAEAVQFEKPRPRETFGTSAGFSSGAAPVITSATTRIDRRCTDALQARRCVVLSGPAGMGKTSMITRLEQQWIDRGLEVHRVSTSTSAQRVSLAALAGLLGRESITIAAAINDLRALSGLLVVDDADLLDDDSAVAIHAIARGQSVLMAVRGQRANVPDAVVRLSNDPTTERIQIEPLLADDATTIIETSLGGPVDRHSVQTLLQTSEGNPLLLHELLDASQRAGTLTRDHGVWILRELTAGSNVREVFRERVARWPHAAAQVVATVAVAESVPRALLVEVFGSALVNEAHTLDAFGVRPGNGEIEIRNALLSEAVLDDLDRAQRHALLRALVVKNATRNDLGVTHLRLGLWLSILGDDEQLDTDLVIQAADKAYSAMHRRESLALAELAHRNNPSRKTLEFLIRVGGNPEGSTQREHGKLEDGQQVREHRVGAQSKDGERQASQQLGERHGDEDRANAHHSVEPHEHAHHAHSDVENTEHQVGQQIDDVLRVGQFMNRLETYVYGLGPLDGLLDEIRFAEATTTDSAALVEYQMMQAWLEFSHGEHTERSIATLGSIAQGELSRAASRLASTPLATACRTAGKLHDCVEIGARLTNATGLATPIQVALGAYCQAEGNIELGRFKETQTYLRLIVDLESSDNIPAKILRCLLEARIALRHGRPLEAARSLGTLTALTAGTDPLGMTSYAHAWLALALSWSGNTATLTGAGINRGSGNPGSSVLTPTLAPAHARYFDSEFQLAHALSLAESGLLIDARNDALALVTEANARGHYLVAMWAAHLALRIQPSQPVRDAVVSHASKVDGDLADAVAQHGVALFEANATALEKTANRFTELGHLSLAHETFVVASRVYRDHAQKTAASRCAAAAERLQTGGCVPTFAVRTAPVVVDALTLREREVSMAIAEGLSQREVAGALGMAIRTVETHLHRAYRKLGVTNAQELHAALNK